MSETTLWDMIYPKIAEFPETGKQWWVIRREDVDQAEAQLRKCGAAPRIGDRLAMMGIKSFSCNPIYDPELQAGSLPIGWWCVIDSDDRRGGVGESFEDAVSDALKKRRL